MEEQINKALLFTAKHFNESCHNFGKPVYLHCVKVAMKLYELGYDEKIVVGGVLHDLLEDTDCTFEDIKAEFGADMAELVSVLSFCPDVKDKLKQSKLMIDACLDYGKDALIIKSIDMCENGKFFSLVTNPDIKSYLISKYSYFTNVASKVIKKEAAFKEYLKIAKNIN